MERKEQAGERDSLEIDFHTAKSGFVRSIALVYVAGLLVVVAISVILLATHRLTWWRLLFNLVSYFIAASLLSYLAYRGAVRTWLRATAAGRAISVTEICSDAVYSIGPDTLINTWSKGAERMLGYTEEEAVGQTVAMLLPEDSIERELPMLEALYRDGIVTRHMHYNVRKGGEVFPTEASMTLLREPDGSPGGLICVLRDMTQQVQLEHELKKVRDEMEERIEELARMKFTRGTGIIPGESDLGAQQEFERLQSAAAGTVRALAAVAERRDPYTAGHQQRVSELATAIAREMGLPEEQVEGIRVAGILHDTGKVVIPAEILSKPGGLSEFEWAIIRTHPRADYEILEGIDFPWPIALAVLQHHERMDGSGYPAGLSGDTIIREAKILAVADVVEAMASHRPYRPARGIAKALEEIGSGRDIRYDPEAADACIRLFEEKGFELSQPAR